MMSDRLPNAACVLRFARKSRSPLAFLFRALRSLRGLGSLRSMAVRGACRLEGGEMWSQTFRDLLREHYDVEVGLHSYGPALWPGNLPRGTRVGNYCSFADGVQVLRRNHPIDRLSQHPFFFNAAVGLLSRDKIQAVTDNPLHIGHDVWIGQNVLIAPGCTSVGNCAVVAAGAVVSKDVPD